MFSFVAICDTVCAEAFNPDEDEEDKEPWVNFSPHSNHTDISFLLELDDILVKDMISLHNH